MKQTNEILWHCKLGDNRLCQVQCDECKEVLEGDVVGPFMFDGKPYWMSMDEWYLYRGVDASKWPDDSVSIVDKFLNHSDEEE